MFEAGASFLNSSLIENKCLSPKIRTGRLFFHRSLAFLGKPSSQVSYSSYRKRKQNEVKDRMLTALPVFFQKFF